MEEREKMRAETDWEELSQEALKDRRKGKRVPLAFPIEVSGFDSTGRLFAEYTTTSNISESGCRFQVQTQLERGDIVAIKLLSRRNDLAPASKPLLFQIAWVTQEAEGWTAGALQLESENLWHMAFPSSNLPKPSSK